MKDNQNELHSVKIRAGSRTYFLNVKEDKNGNLYLVLKESKLNQDGPNEAHRIMVFEDDFQKFITGMREVLEFVKKAQSEREMGSSSEFSIDADSDHSAEVDPDFDPAKDVADIVG
ncbi:MAG: DUF3276 family protein [Patescibacteria group bacterium]